MAANGWINWKPQIPQEGRWRTLLLKCVSSNYVEHDLDTVVIQAAR